VSTPANRPSASRGAHRFNKGFLIATAIIVAVIIYGSLYPFSFRTPAYGIGPVRKLIESWAEAPHRGDFLANIMFYLPFGFFGVLSTAGRGRVFRALALAICGGSGFLDSEIS
jgi:hypothetical protein